MIATLAGLTWMRVRRGRTLVVAGVIAALPLIYAAIARSRDLDSGAKALVSIQELVLAVLPALFVSAAIGEDIESKTMTYLWSRPLPRWQIIIGKLVALVPLALAFQLASLIGASLVGWGRMPSLASCAGLAAAVVAVSGIAAGISTLMPKYGMAFTLCYMLLFDLVVGALPASLREISMGYQAQQIATGSGVVEPLVAMVAVGGTWLGVALWRIRRIEA